jgi:uncharacterized membrane protein YdjX (TVP38/TMEM64 family)
MQKLQIRKRRWLALVLSLLILLLGWIWTQNPELFTLEGVKAHQQFLKSTYDHHPILTLLVFFVGMLIVSNVPFIPFAGLLAVTGGAVFGQWLGMPIIALTHSLGASVAFLFARFFLNGWFQSHFASTHFFLQRTLKQNGLTALFFFRLCPVVPSALINLGMGLSPVSWLSFVWVSLLGMLPGSFLYARAGARLAEIQSLREILSWDILLTFAAIGITPWLLLRYVMPAFLRGGRPKPG